MINIIIFEKKFMAKVINIKSFTDERGSLSVIEDEIGFY